MSTAPVPVTLTLDLEDHRADRSAAARWPQMTRQLLAFCATHGVRMSVFLVGEIAVQAPALVRELAAAGHEIAYHSEHHVPLDREDPARFRRETIAARARLEDLSGQPLRGYRAPVFSLGAGSLWAVETLADLGFTWSSSVLPAANPLHGLAGAPATPFRWPSGIIELPVPVAGAGRMSLPYLGGIYLRYLPAPLVVRQARRAGADRLLWSYVHPYDFDTDEPFARMRGAGWLVSALLWLRRGGSFRRLQKLFGPGGPFVAAPPLGERLPEAASLPVWQPG